MSDGTYAITGLPRPAGAERRTKVIPYVPGLPVRYEISALASSKDPDLKKQWTLFVLALDKFKDKPVDEKLSYFQVAGIHGYPQTAWDHAKEPRKTPENPGRGDQPEGGYCNHNGLNFPTWHRPYMLLFEQCIWENMKAIINHWKGVHHVQDTILDLWRAAADQWRMPYWDWARHQSYAQDFAYPKVLTQASVRIYPPAELRDYYPAGGLYANPFWGFENPEKDEHGDPLPFGSMPAGKEDWNIKDDPYCHSDLPPQDKDDKQWYPWSRTTGISRYGILLTKDKKGFTGLDGVNNPWEANKHLSTMKLLKKEDPNNKIENIKQNPGTLADAVNRMFSEEYNTTWGEFATTKWWNELHRDRPTGYMSLEYIHNNVHNMVGGQSYDTGVGHMMDVPVAAFDPIFWLHHTQCDRLLAIWQCLYPDLWWDKAEPEHEVKIPEIDDNVKDDEEKDPLQPFHTKKNGDPEKDVWTAEMCRDWTELNYQYDDLMALAKDALDDKQNLDEALYKKHLRAYINGTYPSTASLVSALQKQPDSGPDGLTCTDPDAGETTKSWNDYIINVVYDRYALEGSSYAIEFYLGGPRDEKKTTIKPENFVGQVYSFGGGVRRTEGACANCKKQADAGVLSCGQVPLTIQLLHHAYDNEHEHPIGDFTEVDEYLELHLGWRYVGPGGAEVHPSKFPRTDIKVLRGRGELQKAQSVPVIPPAAELKPSAAEGLQVFALQATTPAKPLAPAQAAVYSQYQYLPAVTENKEALYDTN